MSDKIYILEIPNLMCEWDWNKNSAEGLFPEQLQHKSNKKAHWICEKGHEWVSAIVKRTEGQNCPYCSNRRVLIGFNDFQTLCPELAKEWDYENNSGLKPNQVVSGSNKKVGWICLQCGNRWETSIQARVQRDSGCPKRARIKSGQTRHLTNLAQKGGITDQLLLQEWNHEKNGDLVPQAITQGSNQKVWWKCSKCSEEWQASISHRTSGTGCKVCYRKQNRGGSHAGAREIYQYSIDGDFLKKWDCISSASSELKINSSNISMCAKHTRPNAGGFRWEYYYADKLAPIVKVHKSRKGMWGKSILQIDDFGNIIAEYVSLNEASQKLNIDATSISKALNGHIRKAGGYIWKVKNSD